MQPAEIVLVHGGAQNAHTWDTVAMALGRPLVCPDLPGHGQLPTSPAPGLGTGAGPNASDLASVVDDLAPEAQLIVGMSLGGLTSVALADARPDLVRRLVLVDITPGVTGEKAKAIPRLRPRAGDLPELRRAARPHDGVQPDADPRAHCGAASSTTPSSSTTADGCGDTAATTRPSSSSAPTNNAPPS